MSHPAKTCCFPCGCMLNYSCKDDAELWELLRSGAIRRHQLGAKCLLTTMIHGLLRISCSRNPKTPQIRSFFYKKWLLFGALRVNKSCSFMQA